MAAEAPSRSQRGRFATRGQRTMQRCQSVCPIPPTLLQNRPRGQAGGEDVAEGQAICGKRLECVGAARMAGSGKPTCGVKPQCWEG